MIGDRGHSGGPEYSEGVEGLEIGLDTGAATGIASGDGQGYRRPNCCIHRVAPFAFHCAAGRRRRRAADRRPRAAGFSLVEILVVITLVGLLMGFVVLAVGRHAEAEPYLARATDADPSLVQAWCRPGAGIVGFHLEASP